MITVPEIRKFIFSLPESIEIEHWGKPSFRINNKIFAVLQEDGVTLTIKSSHEDRNIYTQMDPKIYTVPESFSNLNYMHMNIELVEKSEAKMLIYKAWSSVAPKKLVKTFNGGKFEEG